MSPLRTIPNNRHAAGAPTPAVIREARRAAGLSCASAAALIYKSARGWEKWEMGERSMDPALWELWRIKALMAPQPTKKI